MTMHELILKMDRSSRRRHRNLVTNARGALVVHAALVMVALILFVGLVVDRGVAFVGRGQAQNAADAGALSGAWTRILRDPSPSPSTTTGIVHDQIVSTVALNQIWGEAPPSGAIQMGWTCPDGTSNCVRVDVFRDGTNGSTALPTYLMPLAGINTQGAKARAVALLQGANATGCMRPWFMIDKYTDVNGNGRFSSPPDTFTSPGYRVPRRHRHGGAISQQPLAIGLRTDRRGQRR